MMRIKIHGVSSFGIALFIARSTRVVFSGLRAGRLICINLSPRANRVRPRNRTSAKRVSDDRRSPMMTLRTARAALPFSTLLLLVSTRRPAIHRESADSEFRPLDHIALSAVNERPGQHYEKVRLDFLLFVENASERACASATSR